ncbi:MAG TPA: hypothetical protein VN829_21000 [Dongiaceae bacterium]|nr:hypothetical protein [Dongiaceae bacterium]
MPPDDLVYSLSIVTAPRGLALLLLLGAAAALSSSPAQEPLPAELTNDFKIHLWNYGTDLRGLLGYKDNVFLSHTNRHDSPFWDSGCDFLVFRVPSGDWSFNGLIAGDYVRYLAGPVSTEEATALALAQAARSFGQHWSSTLGVNYAYQDQLMDLSAIEPQLAGAGRVVGHTLTERWSTRGDYGRAWGELEMAGTRQWLESPLDSYWQFGPKVSLGSRFAPRDDLTLSYQWTRLADDREPDLDRQGNTVTNTHLVLGSQNVQLAWHRAWDQRRQWLTTLTAGFGLDQDNGSGFFNRYQCSLSPRLEYRRGPWRLSAFLTATAYQYPIQTIAPDSETRRTKTWLSAHARAEWRVSKILKLLATYSFDRSFSNLDIDDYYTHTFSMGAEFQF